MAADTGTPGATLDERWARNPSGGCLVMTFPDASSWLVGDVITAPKENP